MLYACVCGRYDCRARFVTTNRNGFEYRKRDIRELRMGWFAALVRARA
jgi:hypothetical protein